jgi:SAM-dependent methyltransferase
VFSRQLLDAQLAESALCVDIGYPRDWAELHGGKPIHFAREAVPGRQNDLVLMMDVLEHVDDDQGLLRHYTKGLPEQARVVISVPAFQWMWSGHDVFLEHRRRYTLDQLEGLVQRAGLKVERGCYFFGALFPALAVTRLWNRLSSPDRNPPPRNELRQYPPWLNSALTGLHELERRTVFPANRLAGLTVFCLARP